MAPTCTMYRRGFVALLLLVAALVAVTFRDYGESWDERFQYEYGQKLLLFYSSFLKDRSALSAGNLVNYGGAFELPAAAAARILPFGIYETRHLFTALCGLAGIVAAWKIARLLGGPSAGFWSALLLAIYPPYYGHMFINSKDIPFAVAYAWSIYYLLRMLRAYPDVSWQEAIKLGATIGLTMGIRVGGIILLLYTYAGFAVVVAWFWRRERAQAKTIGALVAATAISYSVMLLFWPYALSKPLIHPLSALRWLSFVQPAHSPANYLGHYLGIKLPELILVLLPVAVVLSIRSAIGRRRPGFSQAMSYAVLAGASLFPAIYAAATRPFLYDEVRHFLFIIPPLFCIAGLTLDHVLRALPKTLPRLAVTTAVVIYVALLIRTMIQLHPYEYAYYNHLVGGIGGAFEKGYDVEYWATSYKEGVGRLEEYLRRRDGSNFDGRQYRILVGPAEWCAANYFPSNFLMTGDAATAEIYISITRNRSDLDHNGMEIFSIRRLDVPFAVAKNLRSDTGN